MSLTDVYRDRYYAPGYVYIAGSMSGRVLKIGTTKNIRRQGKRLQNLAYGSLDDWVLLYSVWVDEAGRIEHDARRRLRRYQTLRMYMKDGSWQKGREIVECSFSMALEALFDSIGDDAQSSVWQSKYHHRYEFTRYDNSANPPDHVTHERERPTSEKTPFKWIFVKKVDELELSVRSANCLKNDYIVYIGDLVQKTEAEMLRTPNFGRKSLNEIKETLVQMGLHLGIEIPGWPPENIEELSRAIQTPAPKILPFNPAFLKRVEELELSVRSANCLKNDYIVYIGDLVQKTEAEMLRTPNFGRKSLNEIKEILVQIDLHLGIEIPGWPPENIEELSKLFEEVGTESPAKD